VQSDGVSAAAAAAGIRPRRVRASGQVISAFLAAPHTAEPIRLDQFLKWHGLVGTGGEAKQRIQGGEVRVNGFQETRRGRKLKPGDRVALAGQTVLVPAEAGSQP
jgi:ribosome-associated protein